MHPIWINHYIIKKHNKNIVVKQKKEWRQGTSKFLLGQSIIRLLIILKNNQVLKGVKKTYAFQGYNIFRLRGKISAIIHFQNARKIVKALKNGNLIETFHVILSSSGLIKQQRRSDKPKSMKNKLRLLWQWTNTSWSIS
jgi:hypothetical protein